VYEYFYHALSLRSWVLVCVLFAVRMLSWKTPCSLYVDFNERDPLALDVLPFVMLLGHSNSAINPLLYYLMTRHLHRARSTIRRRRPVDPIKSIPLSAGADCLTLQQLGEAVAGQSSHGVEETMERIWTWVDGWCYLLLLWYTLSILSDT